METHAGDQGKNADHKAKELKRLFIALGVLLGIALGFILYLSWPLLTGKTIVLATQPVDPFDILRGQYITIRYEVSTVPFVQGAEVGDTVYVSVQEDSSRVWRFQSVSLTKPSAGTFLKGEVERISGGEMSVNYGIEQFFFERDAQFQTRDLTVEAKVSSSGQARISDLLVNGTPVDMKYQKLTLTS